MTEFRFPPIRVTKACISAPPTESLITAAGEAPSSLSRSMRSDRCLDTLLPVRSLSNRHRALLREMLEYIEYTARQSSGGLANPIIPSSIDDDPQGPPEGEEIEKFDLDLFRNQVKNIMDTKVPGAGYSITAYFEGKYRSVAGGFANVESKLKMSEFQPFMCASVSKMITCAAVLFACKNSGIVDINSRLLHFCPPVWSPRSKIFDTLVILQSLQYKVGIKNSDGVGYDEGAVRDWIVTGGHGPDKFQASDIANGTFQYNNTCYAWFRFFLFYMTAPSWYVKEVNSLALSDWQAAREVILSWHEWYVRMNVLGGANAALRPIGVGAGPSTRNYPYPCSNPCSGVYLKDHFNLSGGSGWFISSLDLARFLVRMRWGNILSWSDVLRVFSTKNLGDGWNGSFATKGGIALYKRGAIDKAKGFVAAFPNGAMIAGGSNHEIGANVDSAIKEAYSKSWKWIPK